MRRRRLYGTYGRFRALAGGCWEREIFPTVVPLGDRKLGNIATNLGAKSPDLVWGFSEAFLPLAS
jgi:hypothetical protein